MGIHAFEYVFHPGLGWKIIRAGCRTKQQRIKNSGERQEPHNLDPPEKRANWVCLPDASRAMAECQHTDNEIPVTGRSKIENTMKNQ
jgi:hypothetical protein